MSVTSWAAQGAPALSAATLFVADNLAQLLIFVSLSLTATDIRREIVLTRDT